MMMRSILITIGERAAFYRLWERSNSQGELSPDRMEDAFVGPGTLAALLERGLIEKHKKGWYRITSLGCDVADVPEEVR